MASGGNLLIPLLLVGVAALAMGGGRRTAGGVAPAAPGGGLDSVRAWGEWVESTGALPGFATFSTAAAHTESGGNNLTGLGESQGILPANVKLHSGTSLARAEANAACDLWEGARGRGYFLENPYDRRYWCFGSGGWFGLLPATGLAAGGPAGPFAHESPFLVFEPGESVIMLADFARRVIRGPAFQALPWAEQNWLAVRRGMKALSLVADYAEEMDSSRRVRERLEDALVATDTNPDFMYTRAEVGDYVGPDQLLAQLRQVA